MADAQKMIPTGSISSKLQGSPFVSVKLLISSYFLTEPIVGEASFDIREQALYVQSEVKVRMKLTYAL
jgi:hypothetical protein